MGAFKYVTLSAPITAEIRGYNVVLERIQGKYYYRSHEINENYRYGIYDIHTHLCVGYIKQQSGAIVFVEPYEDEHNF